MQFDTADEAFSVVRKLYSEQRTATPGEIGAVKAKTAGIKAVAHPFQALRNKRTKSWSTVATDDGYKATVNSKDDWKGIGMPSDSYKQVKRPGGGQLL